MSTGVRTPLAEKALDKLQASSPSRRREGLDDLADLGDSRTIPLVASLLAGDEDASVREHAARVLGRMADPDAVPYLGAALSREPEATIRARAARALGDIAREEAIPYLAAAVTEDPSRGVTVAVAGSLRKIGGPEVVSPLCTALESIASERLRVYIVSVLGELGYAEAAPALRTELEQDESTKVRLASVTALHSLTGRAAVPDLCNALSNDADPQVRELAATMLAGLSDGRSVDCLCKALIDDRSDIVREACVAALTRTTDWEERTDRVLEEMVASDVELKDIDLAAVAKAMSPSDDVASGNGRVLEPYFAELTVGKDERMRQILAAIKEVIVGESPAPTRRPVEAPQPSRAAPAGEPRSVREYVYAPAEVELDPVVRVLREDLRTHFQQPIWELTELTKKQWRKTVLFAQVGLAARLVMSTAVFVAGLVLTAVSASRFLGPGGGTTSVAGAILAFIVGVAMMLLTIYTGPIKDTRQAAVHLGSATVAFMGYVHRLLEISHTFSSLYLTQKLSFDELERSSVLIQAAMNDTMGILNASTVAESNGLLKQTVGRLDALAARSIRASAPPARAPSQAPEG